MFLLAAGQQSGFLGTNAGPSQLGNPTAAGAAKMFSDYRGILSGESWVSAPTMKTSAKPVFVTYSFPKTMTDGDRITFSDSIESWKPFSSRDIVDAREALKQWGDASGITFLETKGDHGDIQFSWLPESLTMSAFAYYPYKYTPLASRPNYFTDYYDYAGNVYMNTAYEDYFKEDAAFKKYTLLHEIGHAIGLKHPFATSEHNPALLSKSLDKVTSTVMAYSSDDDESPTRLGPLDIEAVQRLYGNGSADGTQVANWKWTKKTETLDQIGKNRSDVIFGTGAKDVIKGGKGDDRLHGFSGDDLLIGGAGNDVLLGGVGDDAFRFDAKLVKSRYGDRIIDFTIDEDVIQLSRSIFSKAGPKGHLSDSAFEIGASASTDSARIIYDKASTGALYYDPDGAGSAGRMKLATLSSQLDLKASHFFII